MIIVFLSCFSRGLRSATDLEQEKGIYQRADILKHEKHITDLF